MSMANENLQDNLCETKAKSPLKMPMIRLQDLPRCIGGQVSPHGGNCGRALEFIPGERPPIDGTLQGLDQHQREQLPVSKSLQPHLAEEPDIFVAARIVAFQRKGDRRRDEISHQKNDEEQHKFLETRRIGGVRMKVMVYRI